jgi:hypothetical protein
MNKDEKKIPVIIEEKENLERINQPVRLGIPIYKGFLFDNSPLILTDPKNREIPIQTKALSYWVDKSIKWLLIDFFVNLKPHESKVLLLTQKECKTTQHKKTCVYLEKKNDQNFTINTKNATYTINKTDNKILS